MSEEEKKIIDRINRSYDDNTQYVEASAKDWNYIVHSIRKLHEEIEEKSTILIAGSEKVKQLEKEIEELKEKIVDLETKLAIETIDNKYNQEERDEETIPRCKIREKINQFREVKKEILKNENELQRVSITYDIIRNDYCEKMLLELLEEK